MDRLLVKSAPFFSCPKVVNSAPFFCQICTFFLCNVKRIFCCKISLNWVRLGLGSPQGLEKPPARARKAPCKDQDNNLSYFMVKKGADLTTFQQHKKGADLTMSCYFSLVFKKYNVGSVFDQHLMVPFLGLQQAQISRYCICSIGQFSTLANG